MEYDLALRELGPLDNLRVLDIGSPKLPVLLLARHEHCDLFITDIRDYFIGPSEVFIKKIGKEKSLGENLHLEVQDARSMTYADESFDRIFSISVIEHIEDSGDTDAMLEIYRILKPGGIVTITLPFSSKGYFEEYYHWDPYERKHLKEPKFYQRWYDMTSLHERIIGPSGLRVVSTTFFGEPGLKFQPYWNQIPMRWKIPALFLQPFLAQLLLKRIDPDRLDAACGIAFKLQKPYHEDAAAPNGVRSEKSQ
jgi:SAM-dependent methyltransferase